MSLRAGTADPGDTWAFPTSPTLPPDYSWTQLYNFGGDPAALDALNQWLSQLSGGGFLQTGNSAYNNDGLNQLLVIGNNSLPGSGGDPVLNPNTSVVETPEPRMGVWCLIGLAMLLGGFRRRHGVEAPVEVKEFKRG